MRPVNLPFWLITELRTVLRPPLELPCDDAGATNGFTTAAKISAYMHARGGAKWKIRQVADHNGLIVAIADLYAKGVTEICFDPKPDGSGGTVISFRDLMAICDQPAAQAS